jgi:hypothetical protein
MNRDSLFRALALGLVFTIAAGAQTPAPLPARTKGQASPPKQQPQTRKDKKSPEADVAGVARRMAAVSLLTNLADEARNFRDVSLRARVQARVADALWKADEVRARQLFRRAWDDLEAQEKASAGNSAAGGGDGTKAQPFVSAANLRGEILRLAALRDRSLAEELIESLNEKASGAAESRPDAVASPLDLKPAEVERMELAQQLLTGGHMGSAQDMAGPMLNRVTEQTIRFLSTLRLRTPAAADEQYASLLARAAGDPAADAITVSFLSSYVFSPLFFVSVTREGFTNSSQYGRPLPPPSLSPELRAAFFRAAAQILLRPLPPEDKDRTPAGRPGTYFTILRLLPLFERFAPDYVPALRTQLAALSEPIYTEVFNPKTNEHLTEGLSAPAQTADAGAEQLDLSKARNANERDAAYTTAAQNAATKGDELARDYADKIEDADLRRQVRAYIDFLLVTAAIETRQPEKVLRLVRSDYLTTFQRAWGLTEAARLFKKADPSRASDLLDEALTEARRIDDASPDRVRAFAAVASELYDIDTQRTWALANEIVKAANSAKGFTGEDSRMGVRLKVGGTLAEKQFSATGINLGTIFGRLAKGDMYVAISTAQNLAAEGPRAAALISIARAVLDESPTPSARR